MNILIFGAGAWGTALTIHFSRNNKVFLYSRNKELINNIKLNNENKKYLPDFSLNKNIYLNSEPILNYKNIDLIIIATPTAGLRKTILNNHIPNTIPVIIACKGFEKNTNLLPYQVALNTLDKNKKIAVLSGPVFAQELAKGLPSAICISSKNITLAKYITKNLNTSTLRIYSNTDPIGTSVGAAVKNIIAIGAGIIDGLNYGLNSKAALITRGLEEIKKLALTLGGKEKTLMGLSGLGDLVLTCTGNLSRNKQVGFLLAKGKNKNQIIKELNHVAEGLNAIDSVMKIANNHNIEMPITFVLNKLINKKINAKEAVDSLMQRNPKFE